MHGARPLDKLRKHLIATRQKIVIRTSEEGFGWFGGKALPGTKPLKSGVFVPLTIGDKITSYVSLQNVDRENAFSDSDVRLLETLANSMAGVSGWRVHKLKEALSFSLCQLLKQPVQNP